MALSLSHTFITDKTLHLIGDPITTRFTRVIRSLSVAGCQITNKGIKSLKSKYRIMIIPTIFSTSAHILLYRYDEPTFIELGQNKSQCEMQNILTRYVISILNICSNTNTKPSELRFGIFATISSFRAGQ